MKGQIVGYLTLCDVIVGAIIPYQIDLTHGLKDPPQKKSGECQTVRELCCGHRMTRLDFGLEYVLCVSVIF